MEGFGSGMIAGFVLAAPVEHGTVLKRGRRTVSLGGRRAAVGGVRCSLAQNTAVGAKPVATRYTRVDSVSPFYPMPSPVEESADVALASAAWNSLPEIWARRADSDLTALIDEHHDEVVTMSFKEVHENVGHVAAALSSLGVTRGQIVSIFAESSARGVIVDGGVMTVGAAAAARGVSAPMQELKYIYEHSGSVGAFIDNAKGMTEFLKIMDPSEVKFAVLMWGEVPEAVKDQGFQIFTYKELIDLGKRNTKAEARIPVARRDDIAALLYTSGTTGKPKGVPLTHDNVLHQVTYLCLGDVDPVPGEVFVSILPVWHIFERTAQQFFLCRGTTIAFSNTKNFRNDLAKHRPHFLVGVPRVFEVIYNGVMTKMEKASAVQRAIFFFLYAISKMYVYAARNMRGLVVRQRKSTAVKRLLSGLLVLMLLPLYKLAQILVWQKIRDGVGGRHKVSVSGGGKLGTHLEDFFECAKLTILSGYGLTETSPVISNRSTFRNVRGSVGVSPPGTQMKIINTETGSEVAQGEQGLILAKGLQVMKGYFRDEEATRKAFDIYGYFNTGDLGWKTPEGDLVISGRFKDVIVLSNGENIEPEAIETTLTESPAIEQAMLVGQDERSLGCLLVPSLDFLATKGWLTAEQNEAISSSSSESLRKMEEELMKVDGLKAYYEQDLRMRVKSRKGYRPEERIQHFRLILEPFTVENGLITQTLKMKRNVISDQYKDEVAAMYA